MRAVRNTDTIRIMCMCCMCRMLNSQASKMVGRLTHLSYAQIK